MSRAGILPALFALALTLCLASGAEARKWRSWHYDSYGYSAQSSGDRRSARPEGRKSRSGRYYDQGDFVRSGDHDGRGAVGQSTGTEDRSTRAAESAEPTNTRTGGGAFSGVIDRLVRACLQQASHFQSWPFEDIARIVAPDDAQRGALEALRAAAAAAAEKLSADCPKDAPVPAWARLEAVEQSIDAASTALASVEPTLQKIYATLDDEQKARLLRDLTLSKAQARVNERAVEPRERRSPQRSGGSDDRAVAPSAMAGLPVGAVAWLIR